MNQQQIVVSTAEAILALFLVVAFVLAIVASFYDIRLAMLNKSMLKLRKARKPTISILVFAQNNAPLISSCLLSIHKNHFQNCEVVVIDNKSTDETGRLVRRFKRSHPSFKLRLYSKRQRQDRIEALIAGYNRSQKNELILVIDASDVISPTLLRDSAMRFMHDKKLQALNFDYISTNLSSITMLLQRFKTMSQALVNKFFTTMPGYRINLRGKGMFRQASFKKACKSQVVKAKYDSSLRVLDYGINDDRAVITYQFVRSDWTINYLFVALLALVFQTYSMYVAATLQSKFLLIIGCIATAFWLLLITWASDSLALKDKIKLSFCAPIIYFLIYIQLIVYILSVVFHATTSLARIARGFVRDVVN